MQLFRQPGARGDEPRRTQTARGRGVREPPPRRSAPRRPPPQGRRRGLRRTPQSSRREPTKPTESMVPTGHPRHRGPRPSPPSSSPSDKARDAGFPFLVRTRRQGSFFGEVVGEFFGEVLRHGGRPGMASAGQGLLQGLPLTASFHEPVQDRNQDEREGGGGDQAADHHDRQGLGDEARRRRSVPVPSASGRTPWRGPS